jgi:hypothetical protein
LKEFRDKNITIQQGIIGIKIHSEKIKKDYRPIDKKIREYYKSSCCIVCGSTSDIIIDHKNDLYNDNKVLNINTQTIDDFQPLCNHCNLQKRQICKKEIENKTLYSAKNIPILNVFNDIIQQIEDENKENCFWYDPVKFMMKIKKYMMIKIKNLEELQSSEISRLKNKLKII